MQRVLVVDDKENIRHLLGRILAKHFEALVWSALGLDRHPELRDAYFGNYSRVVLFSQSIDPAVIEAGRAGAERLGLAFEHHHVGLGNFADAVVVDITTGDTGRTTR